MAFLRQRRRPAPRLAPQLDDEELGRMLDLLSSSRSPGPQDIAISQVEQLLHRTGDAWDRRSHRVVTLAGAFPALARKWRMKQPRSTDALVLHAWADVLLGRHAGGLDDVDATLETCRRAADASPADPTPWVAMLAALRVERRETAEVAAVWEEIRRRDPWNREAHMQILGYLSPEERGSHATLREFIDDVVAIMPPQMPPACLPLAAAVRQYHRNLDQGGVQALVAPHYWSQPHAARALGQAASQWLQPGFLQHAARMADLNLLAYALARAGRTVEAGQAFRAVFGLVVPWPWEHDGDPVERFVHWSGRCE
ncbi:hypothetical protein [Streptomyces cyslabdanicus]|uniref:hypothetical protein n=1 Tax=Streptomyces cyslabdanicus TaxID=1470456 RepID=UPI0040447E34